MNSSKERFREEVKALSYSLITTYFIHQTVKVIDFDQLEAGELESPFEPRVS